MNKIIILFLCLCCAVSAAMANNNYAIDKEVMNPTDANIFGHVVDKSTGEHMPGITIILKGTTIGTATDDSGHYMLKNLPEGEFTVEVSFIGFKTVTKKVKTQKGKTQELNFELEEDLISLEGVAVSANVTFRMVKGSNKCTATVSPNFNSNRISFTGTLYPTEQSNVFKGRSI